MKSFWREVFSTFVNKPLPSPLIFGRQCPPTSPEKLPELKGMDILSTISEHMHATKIREFSDNLLIDMDRNGWIYITYLCPFGAWKINEEELREYLNGIGHGEFATVEDLLGDLRSCIEGYHDAD